MKILKFRIRNYRAIGEVEVNLNHSINPIIGVNESGKTSVLNAVLAFDKSRDNFNKGAHLNYQNKYSTKDTENSQIEAFLQLEKSELLDLVEYCKCSTGSPDFSLLNTLKSNHVLGMVRDLVNKNYRLTDPDLLNLTAASQQKVIRFLKKSFPYILYFDDFSDRVPDEVVFPQDYASTKKCQWVSSGSGMKLL